MTRHLIHIGYPKAGSTFLQHWFAAHPEIDYAHGGIAGFGNVYEMAAAAARADDHIRWRVTSQESLAMPRAGTGSLSADHGMLSAGELVARETRACTMLADLFPNAHVLIVTRGFRSLILSSYSQYVRTGGCDDLEAMVIPEGDNPWHFDRLIATYRRAFGERVIVLPFEALARDPAGFRAEIERRLGLAPFDFHDTAVNPSLSPVELRWYPRLARLLQRLPFGHRLRRHFVSAVFHNRLRLLIAVLNGIRPAVPVTGDLVPDSILEGVRGYADVLADEPLFAPYARDYLVDRPE